MLTAPFVFRYCCLEAEKKKGLSILGQQKMDKALHSMTAATLCSVPECNLNISAFNTTSICNETSAEATSTSIVDKVKKQVVEE